MVRMRVWRWSLREICVGPGLRRASEEPVSIDDNVGLAANHQDERVAIVALRSRVDRVRLA